MTAIADLLAPVRSRSFGPVTTASNALVHLANPKRRALLRAIGYEEVPVMYVRALYGPSWAAVQTELRALVDAGLVLESGIGRESRLSLHLPAFPEGMIDGLLGGQANAAYAA